MEGEGRGEERKGKERRRRRKSGDGKASHGSAVMYAEEGVGGREGREERREVGKGKSKRAGATT